MKKIILGLAFLGIGSFAMAQQTQEVKPKFDKAEMAQKRQQNAKAKLDKMAKELNLSADQVRQIEVMHQNDAKARMADNKERQDKMKEERKVAQEKRDAKMKTILSAEQYGKWQELKAQHAAKMKDGKMQKGERKYKPTEVTQK